MTGATAVAVVALLLIVTAVDSHNITAILDQFPDYSLYNQYLTETHVADEVNTRETVTTLVLTNAATTSLAANQTLLSIKSALRLLTLLDYFDPQKLHSIPSGTILTTTLLQTTGTVSGDTGFVNITNFPDGHVTFTPTVPGWNIASNFTKSVTQLPYNLSVLEVSGPILFPGLLSDAPPAINLISVLHSAGCKKFAELLRSTGVIDTYQAKMQQGLTILAPNDEAFQAPAAANLIPLTRADLVVVLLYHAIPSYTPKAALKVAGGGIGTLASSATGRFEISTDTNGDDVRIETGIDSSRIASTVLDASPDCVMTIDNVLLPVEIFGKPPAPAPVPLVPPPPASPVPPPPAPVTPVPLLPPPPEALKGAAVGLKPLAVLVAAVAVYLAGVLVV